MNRIVAAIVAAGLVVAGTAAATPSVVAAPTAGTAQPGFSPAPVSWGPCTSAALKAAGAECGFVDVPLDYAKPDGTKISLAVSRVKHTTAYQGVMLFNPGGPGASGLDYSVLGRAVPDNAGAAYDWIGFDPRGVGSSKPALTCDPKYTSYARPDYLPRTPQLEQTWLDRSKGYATACAKNGPILDHMTTADAARDMDSIRMALGEKQINYYGFSYGTYLGQVYATLFPNNVRRMVLDSNVDPRGVWYQANLDQDIPFERNVKIYFGWLAKHDGVYHLGATESAVEQLWYSQQSKLSANPAGGVIGGDEWTDIFLQAGYYVYGWVDMANAFAGWVHKGDWQALKALYDQTNPPGDDNEFAAYNAVQCTDTQWPTDWQRWRDDSWRTYRDAPFETWGNTWFNASCMSWPAKAGTPVKVDGAAAPGVLLIDEELDAATPFEGTLEVRRLFPKSSVIAAPGGITHAGSLSGVSCVDDKVAAYLATGALPPRKAGAGPDTECPAVPPPAPDASATAKADTAPAQQPEVLRKALAGQVMRR